MAKGKQILTFHVWLYLISIAAIVLMCFSCENEVDIYTSNDPSPVVYCLLDSYSETQYVRIGKTFISGADAYNNAPEGDSTVWKIPYEVYMEEYSKGELKRIISFSPDMEIKKDTGFFPEANLRLYSAQCKPIPGYSYRLYVYFHDLNKMVTAKTIVHEPPQIIDPSPVSIRKVNFETGQPCIVRWYPGPNTGVYQLVFRVHYKELTEGGRQFLSADYSSAGINERRLNQILEHGMGGPSFFKAMRESIPTINNTVREVISLEFIMISASNDLGFHYRSLINEGNNFTNLTDYTNIRNGIGIFSSRCEDKIPNLKLSNVSLDELANSALTSNLGFLDSKGK